MSVLEINEEYCKNKISIKTNSMYFSHQQEPTRKYNKR